MKIFDAQQKGAQQQLLLSFLTSPNGISSLSMHATVSNPETDAGYLLLGRKMLKF